MREAIPTKGTVLIVDDEPRTVEPLRLILQIEGYKVEVAINKSQALQKARDILPDLILLDIMMPPNWQEEGIEVCRKLKSDEGTQHIIIIMLTVRGEEEIKRKCKEAGADDFVNKPFNSKELLDDIGRKLGARQINMDKDANHSFFKGLWSFNQRFAENC